MGAGIHLVPYSEQGQVRGFYLSQHLLERNLSLEAPLQPVTCLLLQAFKGCTELVVGKTLQIAGSLPR